jgi:multidrug efflux pump subunit AcrB
MAHSKALSAEGNNKNLFERSSDKLMSFMRDRLYAPVLRFALSHKWFAFLFMIGLVIITVGGAKGGWIKFTFFPVLERNDVPIELTMPSGTREEITNERLIMIEEAVKKVNNELSSKREDGKEVVLKIERKVGPSASQGSVNAILLPSEFRGISSMDLAALFRKELGPMDDVEKLTFGQASAFGKPVSVTLLSSNTRELDAAKTELREQMSAIPELKDVIESIQQGRKEINLKLTDKAYSLGFNEALLLAQVRRGYFGYEAQRLQRGKDEVKVWVRYSEEQRNSVQRMEDMRIRTADGRDIPLKELAQISIKRGVVDIDHLDGQRQVTIEAELSNAMVSSPEVISRIKAELMPALLAKYPSVSPLFEGQNREAAKTQKSSKFALPFVLLSILAIITLTFRSLSQALVIMVFLVPFSLIGVAWGHVIHGQQMSILSFLGVVALIGIIVNDSLVLIDKMNGFLKEGMPFKDAVFQAGYSRFRAIFLTSATTVAGLAPLILEKSFQAQFLIPMAISVAYGITLATILTLIMLPVFLSAWNNIKRFGWFVWDAGEMPSAESVEPAIIEMKSELEELKND